MSPRYTAALSTVSSPASQYSSVDLPDPEGPTTDVNRPRSSATDTLSSAVTTLAPARYRR